MPQTRSLLLRPSVRLGMAVATIATMVAGGVTASAAPSDAGDGDPVGTYALDMSNPRKPVRTANLTTPAMDTPHESLRLNSKRGLLVADAGSPATNLGFVDVYSVAKDCRKPVWESTLP